MVITRNQSDAYGRNLVEIDPTSLPHLSKQLRDLDNSQKHEKHEIQNLRKMFFYFRTKFEDSRHMEVCPRRIFACRIRFCGQKYAIPSTKPEKLGFKIPIKKKKSLKPS